MRISKIFKESIYYFIIMITKLKFEFIFGIILKVSKNKKFYSN